MITTDEILKAAAVLVLSRDFKTLTKTELDASVKILEALNEYETVKQNHKMLTMLKQELCVEVIDENHQKFNGETYYKSKSGHFVNTAKIYKEVWKYYYGEVPSGYDIHHIDFNPANNNIENLQLLTHSEHIRIHNKARRTITVCKECGKEFEALKKSNRKFCSFECFMKARNRSKYYTDGKREIRVTPEDYEAIYKAQGFKPGINPLRKKKSNLNKGNANDGRLNEGRSNRKDKSHDTNAEAGKPDK